VCVVKSNNVEALRSRAKHSIADLVAEAQAKKPLPPNWRQQIIENYAKLHGYAPGAPLPYGALRIDDSEEPTDFIRGVARATTIEATALAYARRGWKPVPVGRKTKKPIGKGWQTRPFAPAQFDGNAQNIAVQLGAVSGGLTDIDLDCSDAIGFAPGFLPATEAIFGRRSKPCSHQLYVTDLYQIENSAVLKFEGPAGVIVELRIGGNGKGATSVFPPSMHVTGEMVSWEREGEPARVGGDDLKRAVLQLAVACLLKQHYPADGSRHEGALVIGGVLARAGWKSDDIGHVIEAVARAVGDDEWRDRISTAISAVNVKANGQAVPGLKRVGELFGNDVAKTLGKWLGTRQLHSSGKGAGLEDSVALDFAEQHAQRLCFVAVSRQWMRWTGSYWETEHTLRAFDESRKLCRQAGDAKAKIVAGVVALARSDRRIAATTEQWDTNLYLFNMED
jgi:hypothetical protein